MATRRSNWPRELFLSHASADLDFAEPVARTLTAHGVPVWYSKTNLQGAQQWHDEIGRTLRWCDWFAVLLTPSSVRSRWVKRELLFALNNKRYEDRIVPVLLRDCSWENLSWTLDALQFVAFDRFETGCRELLAIWGIGLDRSRVCLPRGTRDRSSSRRKR